MIIGAQLATDIPAISAISFIAKTYIVYELHSFFHSISVCSFVDSFFAEDLRRDFMWWCLREKIMWWCSRKNWNMVQNMTFEKYLCGGVGRLINLINFFWSFHVCMPVRKITCNFDSEISVCPFEFKMMWCLHWFWFDGPAEVVMSSCHLVGWKVGLYGVFLLK